MQRVVDYDLNYEVMVTAKVDEIMLVLHVVHEMIDDEIEVIALVEIVHVVEMFVKHFHKKIDSMAVVEIVNVEKEDSVDEVYVESMVNDDEELLSIVFDDC